MLQNEKSTTNMPIIDSGTVIQTRLEYAWRLIAAIALHKYLSNDIEACIIEHCYQYGLHHFG